jgi:hypothetical protein
MIMKTRRGWPGLTRAVAAVLPAILALGACAACRKSPPAHRTFAAPEEAVRALAEAVKAGSIKELQDIFGPDSQALVDSSDPDTARHNRQIFTIAMREKWQLEDQGADRKMLVIGNEAWPFPIPLVREGSAWRFDTEAGKEEILARRIGRNELAVMRICAAYVRAQRLYAQQGHDGNPAGLYARSFHSDAGRQNGLHWETRRGEKRSPLGDLLADAADEAAARRAAAGEPQPFHGYYFRILTAQGAAAPGGARDYVVNGELSAGFALVAWPARYDASGVMTFVVNQDGVVWEKDLGPETGTAVRAVTAYDPDASWTALR